MILVGVRAALAFRSSSIRRDPTRGQSDRRVARTN